jgi:uncharacterized iron-regulated protein
MILWLASALAGGCTPTTVAALTTFEHPAVFVLGERKGTQPDLGRAHRLAARWSDQTAVTLALQAVAAEQQPILDRYEAGTLDASDLPGLLDFASTWGFPWSPYSKLATAADRGDRVTAIGLRYAPQPDDAAVPRPPGYTQILTDTMAGHYMPAELEPQFAQNVAYLDHRMARLAVDGWSGKGVLIVVADRLHVEGGKGIAYQIGRMVDVPVHTVNLGGPGACYDGDLYLGR